jgi:H+-transporting ATPase
LGGRPKIAEPVGSEELKDAILAMIVERFGELKVDAQKGLTATEAQTRLGTYGPNALEEKEESRLAKLLGYFSGPISYMIEAAALVSALLQRWDDFAINTGLLVFNAGLGFWQDSKAANALAELKKGLALKARALRDGRWQTVEASALVPGDIVDIKLGEVVPADLRLVKGSSHPSTSRH